MRKIIIIFIVIILNQSIVGQAYYSFPKDTARWNCLNWHQWSPSDIVLTNSQYLMQGDTVINGMGYNKIYYYEPDNSFSGKLYIGGLREDSIKNIYFFPFMETLPTPVPISFPNDSSEHLLYTFNNLDTGMVLPINVGVATIKVMDIDSVLMANDYRKRYEIHNSNLLINTEYWIEGIGSTKQLFSCFTYEFEWKDYTLCYTDSTNTYFINSPNGEDSCHYQIPIGINEIGTEPPKVFPNPASESIMIKLENKYGIVNIYNSLGQKVKKDILFESKLELDVKELKSGIYIIEIKLDKERIYNKFVKE